MRCYTLASPILFLTWFSLSMATPVSNDAMQALSLEKRAVPPGLNDNTVMTTVLARVNDYRALHSAPTLAWDATLAQAARKAASKCSGAYTPNNPNGENIYSFFLTPKTAAPDFVLWLKKGIDSWYSQVRDYYSWDKDHSSQSDFTQMVWKGTSKIGCAWSDIQCTDAKGTYYLFCEFSPKGNIAGQFATNVLDA